MLRSYTVGSTPPARQPALAAEFLRRGDRPERPGKTMSVREPGAQRIDVARGAAQQDRFSCVAELTDEFTPPR
jgi:hypothetical protein